MSLSNGLDNPFTAGTGSYTSLVPSPYDIALNGRPYFIDSRWLDNKSFKQNNFKRQSIQVTSDQVDNSGQPGAGSLNRKDLWRRSTENWIGGAGQVFFDREASFPERFRSSKGIDIWTKWQMSLLPDTIQLRSSANTNLKVVTVGSFYYVSDGTALYRANTLTSPTFTSVGINAADALLTVQSFCSDGYNVWAALGNNGVHTTTRGASTSTHYSDLQATNIAFLKGRLMASMGPSIYNITAAGVAPAALFTHANSDFTWIGFAEGRGHIYAGGFSGDKSFIYKIAILPDGTALTAPSVAGELPDGEVIRSIEGYLGNFILIGTDKGARFATSDVDGNLVIGALMPINVKVEAFEPQGKYVWFGWTNYDGVSTGLGRIDLAYLNDGVPAYASDLMVTGQGAVKSIATFSDSRVFAISGLGFYTQSTSLVASGTLDSGLISFGIPDAKTAIGVDVRHSPLQGVHQVYVATNQGAFALVGRHDTDHADIKDFPLPQLVGEVHEVRQELIRATDPTMGPVVTRQTLKVKPAPVRNRAFTLPLELFEFESRNGQDYHQVPQLELQLIDEISTAQRLVLLQIGTESFSVFVDDYEFDAESRTTDKSAWNGTCLIFCSTAR